MSHELRTPLNSSLILAKLLADNKEGNLTSEQVRFAETIFAAGNDLLALINEILDLAKIESGKMDVHPAPVPLSRVRATLLRTFEPMAAQKSLRFTANLASSLPPTLETDAQRLEQILKNLVSNAIKFTEKGEVVVDVAAEGERISFAVRDTGIGIPQDQQGLIFDAFRQADGTTNRKFGGTGLGLSISRELARLLGGDVTVSSEVGEGSTFTLSLPRVYAGATARPTQRPPPPPSTASSVAKPVASAAELEAQPYAHLDPGRRHVLIVEDDEPFARILCDVAKEADFQSVVASTAEQSFVLAQRHSPTGIVLDMNLPDHTGLSALDRLKRDPVTRHIPVHVISAVDYAETALSMGAAAYLLKPVERGVLEPKGVRVVIARNGKEALAALERDADIDLVLMDLMMPEMDGLEATRILRKDPRWQKLPVIALTAKAMRDDQERSMAAGASDYLAKPIDVEMLLSLLRVWMPKT
jgi:CheY-like chemotaxis protein/anti-sigma regulatory factor (Ser/Thr protein kinase)